MSTYGYWLLTAILVFLAPFVSSIMEDGTIELLDSEMGGGVAVEILFLPLTYPAEIPWEYFHLPPPLPHT